MNVCVCMRAKFVYLHVEIRRGLAGTGFLYPLSHLISSKTWTWFRVHKWVEGALFIWCGFGFLRQGLAMWHGMALSTPSFCHYQCPPTSKCLDYMCSKGVMNSPGLKVDVETRMTLNFRFSCLHQGWDYRSSRVYNLQGIRPRALSVLSRRSNHS